MTTAMSGYDGCVGRVGALAVALGVGLAIASLPAVAWADGTGGAGSADSSSSSGTGEDAEGSASDGSSTGLGGGSSDSGDDAPVGDVSEDGAASDIESDIAAELSGNIAETDSGTDEFPDNGSGGSESTDVGEIIEMDDAAASVADAREGSPASIGSSRGSDSIELSSADEIDLSARMASGGLVEAASAPELVAVVDSALDAPAAVPMAGYADLAAEGADLAVPVMTAAPQVSAPEAADGPQAQSSSWLSDLGSGGTPAATPIVWTAAAFARRDIKPNAAVGVAPGATDAGQTGEPLDPATRTAPSAAASANRAPIALNDGPFTVNAGKTLTMTYAQLVGNDTDPDGDALAVNSVWAPAGAVVKNNPATKTVTYAPAPNDTGPASFVYRTKDATGTTSANVAKVTVTVVPAANRAPTAVNDGPFTVNAGKTLTLTYAQLVGNDTDPDGDALAVNSVWAPAGAVVKNNPATKTVTYAPAPNDTGPASFVYRTKDATGTTSANVATVNVTVNPAANKAPKAVNDGMFFVRQGTSLTITHAQLVGNDTDPDLANGDSLTNLAVNSVWAPAGAVVKNNPATKTVTYTPEAGYTGPASFVYRVKDSTGTTSANVATVHMTVTSGPSSAPTAADDGPFIVRQNTPLTLSYAQLVGNDTDADGDRLAVNSVWSPAGTKVVNDEANRTVTYTPAANYTGPASFVYRVKDSTGTTSANLATVTVTVTSAANSAPTAVWDEGPFFINAGETLTIPYAQLVGNDMDPDLGVGDTLSVHSVSVWADDAFVVTNDAATETVAFTPPVDWRGPAGFYYRVEDSTGTTSADVALVTVWVNGNTPPEATATIGAPNAATGVVTGTITAADDDGDALTYSAPATTAKGTVQITNTGAFTYTPTATARHTASAANATATDKQDTFSVKVDDGNGGMVTVQVTVMISPANAKPTAKTSVGTPNSSTGVVKGTVTASDPDKDKLTYKVPATTAKGKVTITSTGAFTYTPTKAAREKAAASNATAADKKDTFTVTVTDGHGGTLKVNVTVAIKPAASVLARPLTSYTIKDRYGGSRNHTGIDLAADTGTNVYAAADGVIYFEGWGTDTKDGPGRRSNWMGASAGISVLIYHASLGIYTGYAHLSNTVVDQGQSVKKGDKIGEVGCTTRTKGGCEGPHLHFEVLKAPLNSATGIDGRVNPENYLKF